MPLDPNDRDVLHLKLPRHVTFATIGTVLSQLEPSSRSAKANEQCKVLLDMTSVNFCSPTGITILAAVIEDLYRRELLAEGAIWLPRGQVMQYLQRMNFFRELEVELPENFTRREAKGFHPVTHVADEDESPAATRALAEAVQEYADLDETSLGALKSCLNEIVENVFYHAHSPVDALVCAQAYKKKKRVELVIADTGRGIREALTQIPEYRDQVRDDCSAIRLALEKNVTATGDTRRGIGLWVASQVIRHNEGELLILSHDGGLLIDGAGEHEQTEYFWPGTLVVVEFRTDRPINTTAVYDLGGFSDADDDTFGF